MVKTLRRLSLAGIALTLLSLGALQLLSSRDLPLDWAGAPALTSAAPTTALADR